MNHPLFQSSDWKLNRLVNAGLDVFTPGFPATDIFGQIGFTGDTHVLPRHIAVCEDDVAGAWIYIAAINKGEIVTARWTLAPGGLAVPPPTSGTTGQYKPFVVDGEAELPSPNKLTPDAAGFLSEPCREPQRRPGGWVSCQSHGHGMDGAVRQVTGISPLSRRQLWALTSSVRATSKPEDHRGHARHPAANLRPTHLPGQRHRDLQRHLTATILGTGTLTIDGRTTALE